MLNYLDTYLRYSQRSPCKTQPNTILLLHSETCSKILQCRSYVAADYWKESGNIKIRNGAHSNSWWCLAVQGNGAHVLEHPNLSPPCKASLRGTKWSHYHCTRHHVLAERLQDCPYVYMMWPIIIVVLLQGSINFLYKWEGQEEDLVQTQALKLHLCTFTME